MKKQLPNIKISLRGFTLIELLVVIAIIAILAIVGFALLTSTQSKARDSRRVQDIIAMSKAMEVNYKVGTGYTTPLNSVWFADGIIPFNPNPNGTLYYQNSPSTAKYTFCAVLENSTGNATGSDGTGLGASGGNYYCKVNQQ